MRRSGLAALALAATALAGGAAGSEAPRRPHVLLILADDLGWNDVGYHGSEIRTPRIDALAAEGLELDRFYAFPTCTPTRAALLTGRSPLVMGLHGPLEEGAGLAPEERTLAELLRDAGYQTALSGKWHLGSSHRRWWPDRQGFDSFYGSLTGGVGYWDKIHAGQYDWQRQGTTERDGRHATDLIADEAVRVLRERDPARPLFLYVAFTAPHVPTEAAPEAVAAYASIEDEWRRVHAAMVTHLDRAVGRVLDELAAQGMVDDTLVIFLSDNGGATPRVFRPWVTTLLRTFDGWASDNAPLRGGKTDVFEGGMRVPAVARWPAVLPSGGRVEPRVTALDWLPTLAEALSLPLAPDPARPLHGQSRWDVLAEGARTPAADFVAGNMASYAYYRGPWKLVEATAPVPFTKPTGTFLFDVERDPYERHDRAAEHPEVVRELRAALAAFPRTESDWSPPPIWRLHSLFGGEETGPPVADAAVRD